MSVKLDKVKSGYVELTATEKAEMRRFIMEYDNGSAFQQRTLTESLDRILNKSLGPKFETTCPCCGR